MSDTTLVLRRVLKAPRMKIYDCWTTPEHMVHWFMPKPHYLSDIEIELRPGGRYRSTMHVDGQSFPSVGCVLDAVPGEKFVFTDMMGEDFQPLDNVELGFTATIELRDHPDGTEYIATARHKTKADSDKHEAMGFSAGWGTVADQLEAYAAGLPD